MDEKEMRVLRCMAWNRAKGEIESMLCTFWVDEYKYEKLSKLYEDFKDAVESEELHT